MTTAANIIVPNGQGFQDIASEIQYLAHEVAAITWAMEESSEDTDISEIQSRAISFRRAADRATKAILSQCDYLEMIGMKMSASERFEAKAGADHSADDTEILKAWDRRQAMCGAIRARGGSLDPDEIPSHELLEMDNIDVLIVDTPTTTAQGALAQAWVSWLYRGSFEIGDRPRIRELVACADFAALDAMGDDLDMVHRLQLRVIRTLRVLAGEALS